MSWQAASARQSTPPHTVPTAIRGHDSECEDLRLIGRSSRSCRGLEAETESSDELRQRWGHRLVEEVERCRIALGALPFGVEPAIAGPGVQIAPAHRNRRPLGPDGPGPPVGQGVTRRDLPQLEEAGILDERVDRLEV